VAYDPGRPWKYIGSLMICVGIATMFYMRAYFFNGSARVQPVKPCKAERPEQILTVPA
jgi:hypothetical protein